MTAPLQKRAGEAAKLIGDKKQKMIRGFGMAFSVPWMAPGMVFTGCVARKGCPGRKIDWSKVKEKLPQYGMGNSLSGESGRAELID